MRSIRPHGHQIKDLKTGVVSQENCRAIVTSFELSPMPAMVVRHWVLLASCWAEPARSLRKAARSVRDEATSLAAALQRGLKAMAEVLELVRV